MPTSAATPPPSTVPSGLPTPRPRPRSLRLQRRGRTAWLAPLAGMGAVVLLAFGLGIAARGEAAAAWREAERALPLELAPGERVLVATRVARRHWWDHFRATHGVLAATDRRLIYVGVVPPALLRPGDEGPTLLERGSYAYDTTLAVGAQEGIAGAGTGVRVAAGDGPTTVFGVAPAAFGRAAAIARVADAARSREAATAARAAALQDSIAALPPPEPLTHRVRAGETIIGIASRYGLTPEELAARNALPSARIRAGQTLVIRRYRRVEGVVEEYWPGSDQEGEVAPEG